MKVDKVNLPKAVGVWTRPELPRLINSKNIFKYMNGAGELYLGYRFDHLEVFDYTSENQDNILVDSLYPLCDKGPQPDPRYQWPYNSLIAVTDPVAAGAAANMLFGLKPKRIGYIHLAQKEGLGTYDFSKLDMKKVVI